MSKKQLSITLDKNVLRALDQYRNNLEFPVNRSQFLETAADYYLTIKGGIKYVWGKKKNANHEKRL